MKIRKSCVELDSVDVRDALVQYALNAYQKKYGIINPGSTLVIEVETREEKSSVLGMRPREIENVCADITVTKRREQMPLWAQELRSALKPLYKDKGELYFNRRNGYIGVKLYNYSWYTEVVPWDYSEVEKIVRETCDRHGKFVTKAQPYLFHVWDNVPAHLKKPVLEDKS